jgi:hypothetical protein
MLSYSGFLIGTAVFNFFFRASFVRWIQESEADEEGFGAIRLPTDESARAHGPVPRVAAHGVPPARGQDIKPAGDNVWH